MGLSMVQGHLQAGGGRGQCHTSPARLCPMGGRAAGGAGAPPLIPCVQNVASGAALLLGLWGGSAFTPELHSESRNYLQIWSNRQQRGKLFIHTREEPRGPSGGEGSPAPVSEHVQGSACSAPCQKTRPRRETRRVVRLRWRKGKGVKPTRPAWAHRQPVAGRGAALPSPSTAFTPPNYSKSSAKQC